MSAQTRRFLTHPLAWMLCCSLVQGVCVMTGINATTAPRWRPVFFVLVVAEFVFLVLGFRRVRQEDAEADRQRDLRIRRML